MKMHKRISFILSLILIFSFILASVEVQACTGILLTTEDGNYIFARTLEFSYSELPMGFISVPRNYKYVGETPTGKPGMSWKTKYAHIGFNAIGTNVVVDGLNEKGLAMGGFMFPGYAKYQKPTPPDYPRTISCMDLVSWILSTCESVAEVPPKLARVIVSGVELPLLKKVPPLHYFAADNTGDAIIIEYRDRKLKIYNNEVNVITNSPEYTWHTTNLKKLHRPEGA